MVSDELTLERLIEGRRGRCCSLWRDTFETDGQGEDIDEITRQCAERFHVEEQKPVRLWKPYGLVAKRIKA